MKGTVIIGVVAMLCLTVVIIVGLLMGYDGALLAGGLASITGVAGGFGAYKASSARFHSWHDKEIMLEAKKHERTVP